MAEDKGHKTDSTRCGIENKLKTNVSRRAFFKKAAVTTVAVAATAGLAKKAADHLIPEGDHQKAYSNDVLPGDAVMSKWEYVAMDKKEKEALVKTLVENYRTSKA